MSSPDPSHAESPIPEPIRAILALFEGPLRDIRFPQVDRETLDAQVDVVEQRRAELQLALEAVLAARGVLEHEQQVLFEQARQAHGYASVFAVAQPELAARIADIKLDTRALAPLKKKRGRKPKQENQTSLTDRSDRATDATDAPADPRAPLKRGAGKGSSNAKLAVSEHAA